MFGVASSLSAAHLERRYFEEFEMVCLHVCSLAACLGGCMRRKPLIGMTWNLAQ